MNKRNFCRVMAGILIAIMLMTAEPFTIYASSSENSMENASEQVKIKINEGKDREEIGETEETGKIEKNPNKTEETRGTEKNTNESINEEENTNSASEKTEVTEEKQETEDITANESAQETKNTYSEQETIDIDEAKNSANLEYASEEREDEESEESESSDTDLAAVSILVGTTGQYRSTGASYELTYKKYPVGIYITGVTGTKQGNLNIPAQINGEDVVGIDEKTFKDCTGFSGELVIPEKIRFINSYAFQGCTGFGKLTLSNGVERIGWGTFENCTNLSGKLVLPNSLTYIGGSAFQGCTGFSEKLILPNNLEEIGWSAFQGCTGFSGELTLSNNLKEIGGDAFQGCTGFSGELVIPTNIKYIESGTFQGCTGFSGELVIPANIESIWDNAFQGCTGLSGKLVIPNNIERIGSNAFSGCNNITEIEVKEEVKEIRNGAFANDGSKKRNIYIYNKEAEIYGIDTLGKRNTIYGYAGSMAEICAKRNSDNEFVYLDGEPKFEEYRVKNTTELLKAIGSHRKIILADGMYDLGLSPLDIGKQINLTIEAEHPDRAEFLSHEKNRPVVNIKSSTEITISGCIMGHESAGDEELCGDKGDVIFIYNSGNINIKNCDLYGCGIWGVAAEGASTITVEESVIRDCTQGIISNYDYNNDNIFLNNCILSGNAYTYAGNQNNEWIPAALSSDNNINLKNCTFLNNYNRALYLEQTVYREENCSFYSNVWDGSTPQASGICLNGITWQVEKNVLKLGFPLTLDKGTIESKTGKVLSYSASSLPWKNYKFDSIEYAEGIEKADERPSGDPSGDAEKGEITDEDWAQIGPDGVPQGLWISAVPTQAFTGKAIKPAVRVYNKNIMLIEKKDYTLSYANNTKANDGTVKETAPKIIINGKGNYNSREVKTFAITPKNLNDADITADTLTLKWNDKIQKPIPKIFWNGMNLAVGKDFDVSYPDTGAQSYQAPGTYKILITGKGNYDKTKELTLKIAKGKLVSELTVSPIKDQTCTGIQIRPDITVKDKNATLTKGTDYQITYENNVDIGTAYAVIDGLGDVYIGRTRVPFKIKAAASLKNARVQISAETKEYSGTEVKPANHMVKIETDGVEKQLTENIDYKVDYLNNIQKGTAAAIFKGIGKYDGVKKVTYKIMPYSLNKKYTTDANGKIIVEMDASYPYAKGGCTPKPTVKFDGQTLIEKVDYTLSYKNHTTLNNGNNTSKMPTITITGKGNFTGKLSKTFLIGTRNIKELELTAEDKVYQPKNNIYKTRITIKDTNGKSLTAGKDYDKNTIMYAYNARTVFADGTIKEAESKVEDGDIIPAGTVIKVTVSAKGNCYTESISGTYRITEKSIAKLSVEIPVQTYTGEAVKPDGDVKVWINKKSNEKLPETEYEIISYSNNVNKGTATLTIRGKNNYGGIKTFKFKIAEKKISWSLLPQ